MAKVKVEKKMFSEMSAGMDEVAMKELQEKVEGMNEPELETFLCEIDPDSMGFTGEECPV